MGAVVTAEQFAHQRGFRRPIREKTRPARHKTPISVHFSFAGRICLPTGHSDVATLKPMTPLRPPMQASVKPPSPLLAPQQHPLKPTTPLQPKNTPKTPICHPQRRWRFQLAHLTGPQRRQGFQPDASSHEQRRRRFQTTAHLASGLPLHHQRHPCARPSENSHTIRLGKVSIKPENSAIPTPIIQISKYSQGNCMRNWLWAQECGK